MARKIIEIDFEKELAEKYKCSICTGLLETPVLTECCEQHFCQECLEKWTARNNTCPHCRAERPNKMVSKALEREIDELKAYCKNKKNGCKMTVMYSELEKHENDCPFKIVTCPKGTLCAEKILKKDLEDHLSQKCIFRIVHCQLCNEEVPHSLITLYHSENDCRGVISCSNNCGEKIERKDKNSHEKICPLKRVVCPFSEAGCNDRIARRDLDEHISTSLQQHLSLMLSSHLELREKHEDLRIEYLRLQNRQSELQGKYDTVLSSVADKLQSTSSPQEQLADIGECIQPFLHVLKPESLFDYEDNNIVTLQFSKIGCKPLEYLEAITGYKWRGATPPFCIDGYPGCKIYITYQPLTIVMELVQPEAEFPPNEVLNQVGFSFQNKDIYIRDSFLLWENYALISGQKVRLSKYKGEDIGIVNIQPTFAAPFVVFMY